MLLKHTALLGDIGCVPVPNVSEWLLLEWVFCRFISITVIKGMTFSRFLFKGVSTVWRLSSTLINYFQTCMWTRVKAGWRLRREAVVAQDCEIRKGSFPALSLLWCYPWVWTLADCSPSSAVCRLHSLSFCNKTWLPAVLARPRGLFPIFIPILLQKKVKRMEAYLFIQAAQGCKN